MSPDRYSARVRSYFDEPAHAGVLPAGESVRIDGQEVRVEVSATAANGVIRAMRFRAWGCPHTIAAAEAACAALEGRPIADLLEFPARDLMDYLAVPIEKTGRILVIEDAVRSLGQRFGEQPEL